MDAFAIYKQADGQSALAPLSVDSAVRAAAQQPPAVMVKATRSDAGPAMAKTHYYPPVPAARIHLPRMRGGDKADDLESAIARLAAGKDKAPAGNDAIEPPAAQRDPMQIFRQQMAYMDSMRQASDPALAAQARQRAQRSKSEQLRSQHAELAVEKAGSSPGGEFSTLQPKGNDQEPIMAAIDEEITGYAGSRIRLRLLSDIRAGGTLIKSGTCLYATLSGFSAQRVTLAVHSLFYQGDFLPVNLQVYDLDGLEGLYVPDSRFRDFTRDLGSSSMQGVSIDGNASQGSQFVMSTAGKVFESASSAIASAIRKNKARIKFNSYIYLVDQHATKVAQ